MNTLEAKNLIKQLIISNNITSEAGLLSSCDLSQQHISKVIDWLLEDGFITIDKHNVAGRTFTINKD